MAKNKIDIRTGSLFPWHFQFLAVIGFLAGLLLLTENTMLAVLLMVGSVFVLSAYSGIQIDKVGRLYREYSSFFLIKAGGKISYQNVEKLFINSSRVKQQTHSAYTGKSSVFSKVEYNGYLKFSDGTKIHLLSKNNKAKLVRTLKEISTFLNVRIEDHSSR